MGSGVTVARPLVVRRRVIEQQDRPTGEFAAVAAARGLLPGVATRSLGTFCFNTHDRVVGLTYDDGPNPENTPGVLDALAEHGATATFFVMAGRAEENPRIVRRMLDEGHEVALHGRDHRWLPSVGLRDAYASIRDARHRVERVAGRRVRRFRPPYGGITPAQAVATWSLGLECVIWTSDAWDWVHGEEAAVAARAAAGVFPGGIVLLHDDRADPEIAGPEDELPHFDRGAVLRRLLEDLDERGYAARSVEDLARRYQQVRSFSRDRVRAL